MLIADVIKDTRKKKGLNQRDFGSTLTVSQSYISRIEKGKEEPSKMFLKLFCLVYSVNEGTLTS